MIRKDPKNISKNSPVPIYRQLYDQIRCEILSGRLKPNTKLPSEADLCKQYHISRMTVRAALSQLEQQAIIYRRPGKGTFVATPKIPESVSLLTGFEQKLSALGYTVRTKVLNFNITVPLDTIRTCLNLDLNEKVYEITRLRYVDNEPVALQTVYLPEKIFPGLLEEDLSSSLTAIIHGKYGLRLVRSEEVLCPIVAGDYEASILQVKKHSPLLMIEATGYTPDSRPVRYTQGIYRADRLRFIVHSYVIEKEESDFPKERRVARL